MDSSKATPTLSARERERNKTKEEKAADIAYTINHALVCAASDVIDPFVAAWSQKNLGKKIHTSWCNFTHDHGEHDHTHKHDNTTLKAPFANPKKPPIIKPGDIQGKKFSLGPKQPEKGHIHGAGCGHFHDETPTFGGALKHWVIGEAIGDIGAVPITIAMQRYAPEFMEWLNTGMESIFGSRYEKSSQKAAITWALKNHIDPSSPEIKRYGNELYHHEVRHFGQAAVWTVASIGLNIASQKLITGNRHPISYMLLYKTLGAATSATLLLGGRAFFPEKFRDMDHWTSKNIFAPISSTVGNLFGVDEKEIKHFPEKPTEDWQKRTKESEKMGLER